MPGARDMRYAGGSAKRDMLERRQHRYTRERSAQQRVAREFSAMSSGAARYVIHDQAARVCYGYDAL